MREAPAFKPVSEFTLEPNEVGEYVPCGFCALPFDLKEDSPGEMIELGTLIRSPHTNQRDIGKLATFSALGLPVAQRAKIVIAYANQSSLHVFLKIGGKIISAEDLSEKFPFLPEYSGDTIVDLTEIKSVSTR